MARASWPLPGAGPSSLPVSRRVRPLAGTLVLLPWLVVLLAAAAVGLGIGTGHQAVIVLALVPALAASVGTLMGSARWYLVLGAIGIGVVGQPLTDRLPVGGMGIWLTDLILVGAIGGFLVELGLKRPGLRPRLPRTWVLGLPFLLFVVALSMGALKGHERYGATLIGNPLRLVGYAAIVAALPGLTPTRALRGITTVMYGGAVWLGLVAAFHIATGTSATDNLNLSTGGIRYIGIAAATYAAAAFVLAILNLGSGRGWAPGHLIIALIAGFDVIVAYTRTMWLALTVILIVAIIVSPRIRSALAASIPLVVPLLLFGVLVVLALKPDLATTLVGRISTPAGQDSSVEWREHAYRAVLSGTSQEPWLGIGFGRETSFSLNGQPNFIAGDPHNGFIYVFAGSGVVGLAALLVLLGTFLADSGRRWRWADGEGRTLIAWSVATWTLFMVHAASEPVFTTPSMILVIWICMLLPAVMVVGRRTASAANAPA